jgi:hypothetical protein
MIAQQRRERGAAFFGAAADKEEAREHLPVIVSFCHSDTMWFIKKKLYQSPSLSLFAELSDVFNLDFETRKRILSNTGEDVV